jgi:hypothetical protein
LGNYNFDKDLLTAKKTERYVGDLIMSKGATAIAYNHDGDYDLMVRMHSGEVITFEIKEDFMTGTTGNIALEFESRGKPSGIQRSKADFYIYVTHMKDCIVQYTLLHTSTLKEMIKTKQYITIITGGDKDSQTKFYIFKDYVFLKNGKLFHQTGIQESNGTIKEQ